MGDMGTARAGSLLCTPNSVCPSQSGHHRSRTPPWQSQHPALLFSLRVRSSLSQAAALRARLQLRPHTGLRFHPPPPLAPGLRGADRGGSAEVSTPWRGRPHAPSDALIFYSRKSPFLRESNTPGTGVGPETPSSRPSPTASTVQTEEVGLASPSCCFIWSTENEPRPAPARPHGNPSRGPEHRRFLPAPLILRPVLWDLRKHGSEAQSLLPPGRL